MVAAIDRNEVKRLLQAGMLNKEIASALSINITTVSKIRKKLGMGRIVVADMVDLAEARRLFEMGYTQAEVARKFEISPTLARRVYRQCGLSDYAKGRPSDNILRKALKHVNSVPYLVSLRWVFYRLLQDGLYRSKDDYDRWGNVCASARKDFHKGWHPTTLKDDTREIILRGGVYETLLDALEDLPGDLAKNVIFSLDHFYRQDCFVMILFEARAMADQFKYYTKEISLVPFGGDPSIPFKWEIAKKIEREASIYGKPIKLLYFGDADEKGQQIPESAMKDIEAWCNVDFEFIWCGLTMEQVETFKGTPNEIPENPEKPGEYQWEAVTDEAAKEIIEDAVSEHIDMDLIDRIDDEVEEQEEEWREKVQDAIQKLVDEYEEAD